MLCAVTVAGGSSLSGFVCRFVWVAMGGGSGLSGFVWVAVGGGGVLEPPLAAWLAVCRPCPLLGPREQYRPIAVRG